MDNFKLYFSAQTNNFWEFAFMKFAVVTKYLAGTSQREDKEVRVQCYL